MSTIYIAAEKFIYWNGLGDLDVDASLIDAIASSDRIDRKVVYFAPNRFGFWYDDMRDVEDAWDYLYSALKTAGFKADDVILFQHEVENERFLKNDSEIYVLSSDSRDESLAELLNARKLSEIPYSWSGFWHRMDIRRGFRALFAALSAS